jgi:hypothetical protein
MYSGKDAKQSHLTALPTGALRLALRMKSPDRWIYNGRSPTQQVDGRMPGCFTT